MSGLLFSYAPCARFIGGNISFEFLFTRARSHVVHFLGRNLLGPTQPGVVLVNILSQENFVSPVERW